MAEKRNAYKELLATRLDPYKYKEWLQNCSDIENYDIEEHEYREWPSQEVIGIGAEILPKINSSEAKHWVSSIAYAGLGFGDRDIYLRSSRTEEDEMKFLEFLKSVDYDPGYGWQELYGIIVFEDGSWLERWEYDGSEGWSHKHTPSEKDVCYEPDPDDGTDI